MIGIKRHLDCKEYTNTFLYPFNSHFLTEHMLVGCIISYLHHHYRYCGNNIKLSYFYACFWLPWLCFFIFIFPWSIYCYILLVFCCYSGPVVVSFFTLDISFFCWLLIDVDLKGDWCSLDAFPGIYKPEESIDLIFSHYLAREGMFLFVVCHLFDVMSDSTY